MYVYRRKDGGVGLLQDPEAWNIQSDHNKDLTALGCMACLKFMFNQLYFQNFLYISFMHKLSTGPI